MYYCCAVLVAQRITTPIIIVKKLSTAKNHTLLAPECWKAPQKHAVLDERLLQNHPCLDVFEVLAADMPLKNHTNQRQGTRLVTMKKTQNSMETFPEYLLELDQRHRSTLVIRYGASLIT